MIKLITTTRPGLLFLAACLTLTTGSTIKMLLEANFYAALMYLGGVAGCVFLFWLAFHLNLRYCGKCGRIKKNCLNTNCQIETPY